MRRKRGRRKGEKDGKGGGNGRVVGLSGANQTSDPPPTAPESARDREAPDFVCRRLRLWIRRGSSCPPIREPLEELL